VRTPASLDEAKGALLGRWARCAGWGVAVKSDDASANPHANESIGVEITGDGHYYLLRQDDSCNLVRGNTVDDTGTYSVESRDGTYFVKFVRDEDRSDIGDDVSFFDGPSKMHLAYREGWFTTDVSSDYAYLSP
jgi:hypothetical protein